MVRAQRQFERLTLPREELDFQVVVRVGAVQVFQVGRLIGSTLGVEEARIYPHELQIRVGTEEECHSSAGFLKNFSVTVEPMSSSLSRNSWRPGDASEPGFRGDQASPDHEQDEMEGHEEQLRLSHASCGKGLDFWACLARCCSAHSGHHLPGLPRPTLASIGMSSIEAFEPGFCQVSFWALKEEDFNSQSLQHVGDGWYHKVRYGGDADVAVESGAADGAATPEDMDGAAHASAVLFVLSCPAELVLEKATQSQEYQQQSRAAAPSERSLEMARMQQLSNELFNEAASIGDQILAQAESAVGTAKSAVAKAAAAIADFRVVGLAYTSQFPLLG
ncbi:LECRK53 [Symbiodinium sp. CCMP2592]|nr:LECRK53 [Symbiodinium sp. CCMP2592]